MAFRVKSYWSLSELTVFENHRKSLIQQINIASKASYVYILSGQKWSILASFWKPEACGQTVLPDRSVLIGQKVVENAKIEKFKCDILGDFQTLCTVSLFGHGNLSKF